MTASQHSLLGITGQVPLSDVIRHGARELSAKDYAECVEAEFCLDEVRDLVRPAWLGDVDLVLPVLELRSLGLAPRLERAHLYATCGVEPHIDDMDGLSVGVVLHSDGFTFTQGGASSSSCGRAAGSSSTTGSSTPSWRLARRRRCSR